MKRLVFRLLMIMLALYGLGIMAQLYAHACSKPHAPSSEPGPPPPSELGKTMSIADIILAPSRLSAGGCGGVSSGPIAQVPSSGGTGEEPGMTEAQKKAQQEEIAKIQADANNQIKRWESYIDGWNREKQEGTSTFTNEQIDRSISHYQEMIEKLKRETDQKIADIKAGKVKPPAPPETMVAATRQDNPLDGKPSEEKKKPDKERVKPDAGKQEPKAPKTKQPAEKTEKEKLRDQEWAAEKLNPLAPPDREHDPELNKAVDAIADNIGIGVANSIVNGKAPISLIDFTGKDLADLLKDTATSGPLAAAGKKVAEKGVEYGVRAIGSEAGRAAIERLYREHYEGGIPSNSRDDERLAGVYARSQGCPEGQEKVWIAAYLINRKQNKDLLTARINRYYKAYKDSIARDWSEFGLPAKARYQKERQSLINQAGSFQ